MLGLVDGLLRVLVLVCLLQDRNSESKKVRCGGSGSSEVKIKIKDRSRKGEDPHRVGSKRERNNVWRDCIWMRHAYIQWFFNNTFFFSNIDLFPTLVELRRARRRAFLGRALHMRDLFRISFSALSGNRDHFSNMKYTMIGRKTTSKFVEISLRHVAAPGTWPIIIV